MIESSSTSLLYSLQSMIHMFCSSVSLRYPSSSGNPICLISKSMAAGGMSLSRGLALLAFASSAFLRATAIP
jgi:hypothetical protein